MKTSGKGSFIVLEGIDGCGKSTHTQWLQQHLQESGHQVLHFREPGGNAIGEQIRSLFLNPSAEMSPRTELLLLFAARAQLLWQCIQPALQSGSTVVCDRFVYSSYAYQGEQGAGSVPEHWIQQLQQLLDPYCEPDLVLLFDLSPELAIRRRNNSDPADKYDNKGIEFMQKVRQSYLQQARARRNMQVVDASQPVPQVQAEIQRLLEQYV